MEGPSSEQLRPRRRAVRAWAWCAVLCALVALLWLRSHFRADRVRWFRDNGTAWQIVSARGRIYLRWEDLGYALPGVDVLAESIRAADRGGRNYRLNLGTLGREVDKRFAGFEFARGEDRRLDFWGYRLTYGPDTQTLNAFWSVQVPDWFIVAALAVPPLRASVRIARRRRRAARGQCVNCGYDVRHNTGRCPECGEPVLAGAMRLEAKASQPAAGEK